MYYGLLLFPGGSDSKTSVSNAGDPGSIPWVGKIPWRRKWQPTPVLLPGKSHGQRNLVGYSPWGRRVGHYWATLLTLLIISILFYKINLLNLSCRFLTVMYRCESWTVKKDECRKIDDFELWCWRRLLRVPWTARRSNQSILKEISSGCLLEGLMLKLKLQYFGQLMRRADALEKTQVLGGIGERRRRGRQRMRWLDIWLWLVLVATYGS